MGNFGGSVSACVRTLSNGRFPILCPNRLRHALSCAVQSVLISCVNMALSIKRHSASQ